ncbi:MAG: bifunctional oligoribonuclease/PAP phosphatase NrnA [candidate division WS1 bacterium]|jgi:phosphoesterase RecJ-like protein|nr:bifunctional oligoribonuclease/PAP phosphatase NrnA [candidate division WS1 bacterium]
MRSAKKMSPEGPASAVAHAIEAAETVFIAAHENPDGDAVGSLLALRSMLLRLGKEVHAATPTAPPERFAFLESVEAITTEAPAESADLAIALDCDGAGRLAGLKNAVLASPTVVDIDHHRRESAFGDIQYVVPGAAATAVLVAEVARALDLQLTSAEAMALYTALIADTGGFRFSNTSPEALRLGADLVEVGADPETASRELFSVRPLSAAHLEGRALSSLQPVNSQILISTLSLADFEATGALQEATDGIIDSFRYVTGVRIAALLKESDPDVWQVSLRGNGVDVASVASSFGGGGHTYAAGCTIEGPLAVVRSRLTEALEHALMEAPDA